MRIWTAIMVMCLMHWKCSPLRRVGQSLCLLCLSIFLFPFALHRDCKVCGRGNCLSIWIFMVPSVPQLHMPPLDRNWNDICKINMSLAMLIYGKIIIIILNPESSSEAPVMETPLEDVWAEGGEKERWEIPWDNPSLQDLGFTVAAQGTITRSSSQHSLTLCISERRPV